MSKVLLTVFAVLVMGVSQATAQNLLSNPGFEDPTSTTTSVDNWQRFGSGAAGFAEDSTAEPHSGASHIDLVLTDANQFAGVFQTLEAGSFSPGQTLVYSGWHKAVGTLGATVEMKIEWAGAPLSLFTTTILGNTYEQFSHSAVVPAGVTGAAITYAIASFTPGATGASQVYLDDLSASVVIPEPATVGLLLLGSLSLVGCRRR